MPFLVNPREIYHFFLLGRYIPTHRHTERDNSPLLAIQIELNEPFLLPESRHLQMIIQRCHVLFVF